MDNIQRYIEFAIENGFMSDIFPEQIDVEKITISEGLDIADIYGEFDNNIGTYRINIIQNITSKEFIESIARGFISSTLDEEMYDSIDSVQGYITTQQAIAIRDGALDEFIENILPNQ